VLPHSCGHIHTALGSPPYRYIQSLYIPLLTAPILAKQIELNVQNNRCFVLLLLLLHYTTTTTAYNIKQARRCEWRFMTVVHMSSGLSHKHLVEQHSVVAVMAALNRRLKMGLQLISAHFHSRMVRNVLYNVCAYKCVL
jgi:hypothetical protein